ncbi:hypothetical protein V6N13_043640 [Hibiscus sabdariffa]|uniref:Uncharacterized protein n=1 Tax=Hibiscus sabdariffa TaxID=183260 RepID=A0ABR2RFR4_9ROSI
MEIGSVLPAKLAGPQRPSLCAYVTPATLRCTQPSLQHATPAPLSRRNLRVFGVLTLAPSLFSYLPFPSSSVVVTMSHSKELVAAKVIMLL